jgi:hypothetical protein
MAECGRQDRDCRIVVISPFLVEPDPSAPPAALPPAAVAPPAVAMTNPAPSAGIKSPDSLATALAAAVPALEAAARADLVTKYEAVKAHKALAVVPGTASHWRTSGWPSPAMAAEKALERCQVFYGKPCALVAVDGHVEAIPGGGKWPVWDMPRVRYAGAFDPEHIPGIGQTVRERPDVVGYRRAAGPKAAALHPWGSVFTAVAAASQPSAEASALAACNADPTRQGQDGPCHLYAAGDQVILPQRRIAPAAAEEAKQSR